MLNEFFTASADYINMFTHTTLDDFRKIKEDKIENFVFVVSYVRLYSDIFDRLSRLFTRQQRVSNPCRKRSWKSCAALSTLSFGYCLCSMKIRICSCGRCGVSSTRQRQRRWRMAFACLKQFLYFFSCQASRYWRISMKVKNRRSSISVRLFLVWQLSYWRSSRVEVRNIDTRSP